MSDGHERGAGELHLGWHEGSVCLGAGPARIRLSRAEARALVMALREMLRQPEASREPCACGADSGQDDPGADPAADGVRDATRAATRAFQGF